VCSLALERNAGADEDVSSFHLGSSAVITVAQNTVPKGVGQTMLLLDCAAGGEGGCWASGAVS